MSRRPYPWMRSQEGPAAMRYGLPWCLAHDAYAPRRYDPFALEVRDLLVAMYLCDECVAERRAEV